MSSAFTSLLDFGRALRSAFFFGRFVAISALRGSAVRGSISARKPKLPNSNALCLS